MLVYALNKFFLFVEGLKMEIKIGISRKISSH